MLVGEVHQEQSMLCRSGLAVIRDGRVVASVTDLKTLLPDSGAEENEISYEVAEKLGLLNGSVPLQNGPTIQVSSGTYETYKVTLRFQINGLDLQQFDSRFKHYHYPDIVKDLEFLFPKQPGNRNNWQVLIGKKSASELGLILEFV